MERKLVLIGYPITGAIYGGFVAKMLYQVSTSMTINQTHLMYAAIALLGFILLSLVKVPFPKNGAVHSGTGDMFFTNYDGGTGSYPNKMAIPIIIINTLLLGLLTYLCLFASTLLPAYVAVACLVFYPITSYRYAKGL